jgi:hypothetical protein
MHITTLNVFAQNIHQNIFLYIFEKINFKAKDSIAALQKTVSK